MAGRPDYFGDDIVELIIRALYAAYEANTRSYDPSVGNTPVSFGVSVWQSSLYYLEKAFGAVVGAKVFRSGSVFRIELDNCRISFYKFGSSVHDSAEVFRLNGNASRARALIIENNQMSLFTYTMDDKSQPVAVPELVVVHSGNAFQGLLEVHIGAPISDKKLEHGWLWLEQVYEQEFAPAIETEPQGTSEDTITFKQQPEPVVDVEEQPEKQDKPKNEDA